MLVNRRAQPLKEAPALRREGAPASAIILTVITFVGAVARPPLFS
jgi:hypothetical protein